MPLLAGAAPFRTAIRQGQGTGATTIAVGDGLRDLRLYDAAGAEVGYILLGTPPAAPVYTSALTLPVAPVDTDTVKTSGFEADLGEPMIVDRFRVEGVERPFLKRVRLEGSGDRQRWTLLVGEGTLFDLPDEQLQQVELRFTPGAYRYLRLTWDDRSSARVTRTPDVSAGRVPAVHPPPPLTTPLTFERRASEPGRSRFRVRLPAGRLPIVALDLDAGGGHILREARIFQAQLSASRSRRRPRRSSISRSTMATIPRSSCAASRRSLRSCRGSISRRRPRR